MDRDDLRQSIHEIGLARRMVLSPGRPEMVTVSSPSMREGGLSPLESVPEEVGHDVGPTQQHYDDVEGKSVWVFCVGLVVSESGLQGIWGRWELRIRPVRLCSDSFLPRG